MRRSACIVVLQVASQRCNGYILRMLRRIHILLLITLLLGGCAKQGPPPGGPEDNKPPLVVETIPVEGAIEAPVDQEITFVFDERVQRESLANAFTCSPPPPGEVRAKWDGYKKVSLIFDPPLLDDRTYVITLGTELTDLRRNKGEESIHLAFSTGDKLDQGLITGILYAPGGQEALGWYVNGYFLGAGDSLAVEVDSLGAIVEGQPDPAYDLPDASTQAGKGGQWELRNLKDGWWRVFAFQDGDRDRLWTPKREPLAVPTRDVYVVGEILTGKQDTTARDTTLQDTVETVEVDEPDSSSLSYEEVEYKSSAYLVLYGHPPQITPQPDRIYVRTQKVVLVRFNPRLEALGPVTFTPENGPPIDWIDFDPVDSSRVWINLAEAAEVDSLRLNVKATFSDTIHIDTTFVASMESAAETDTISPRFSSQRPPEGTRLRPELNRIHLIFNEPMAAPPDKFATVYTQDDTLSAGMRMVNRSSYLFQPPTDVTLAPEFVVQFPGSLITDAAGNTMADSLVAVSYPYLPTDSLGTVSGWVEGEGFTNGELQGPVHVRLQSVQEESPDPPLDLVLNVAGEFTFKGVPAGQWRLAGWVDRNGDGVLSPGWPMPFQPAELYFQSTDTVFVRARWETGENVLTFPR